MERHIEKTNQILSWFDKNEQSFDSESQTTFSQSMPKDERNNVKKEFKNIRNGFKQALAAMKAIKFLYEPKKHNKKRI